MVGDLGFEPRKPKQRVYSPPMISMSSCRPCTIVYSSSEVPNDSETIVSYVMGHK